MDLEKYIIDLQEPKERTKILSDGECAKYCINVLNKLVHLKSNGRNKLEITPELNYLYKCFFGYLNNDERVKNMNVQKSQKKWDLDKGIIFIGEFGSGKTLLLDFLREVKSTFKISGVHTNAYNICKEYQLEQTQKGYEGYQQLINKGCLFIDEVGDEPKVSKSYGNEENIIYRTLKLKFDRIEAQNDKDKVFLTSNLSLSELENRYGERLMSRIIGNMNIVMLGVGNESKSYRK